MATGFLNRPDQVEGVAGIGWDGIARFEWAACVRKVFLLLDYVRHRKIRPDLNEGTVMTRLILGLVFAFVISSPGWARSNPRATVHNLGQAHDLAGILAQSPKPTNRELQQQRDRLLNRFLKGADLYYIEKYTAAMYIPVNRALWADDTSDPSVNEFVLQLDGTLAKLPNFRGLVQRGIRGDKPLSTEYGLGNHVLLKGFSSSSKYFGDKFVGIARLFLISKSGKDITSLSTNPDEGEVLFRHHTSFVVLDCGSGKTEIGNDVQECLLEEVER